MFTELMPLIEQRPLTITVATLNGGLHLRVNVVPQTLEKDGKVNDKIGYSNRDRVAKVPAEAIKALTTPLSLIGTAQELDAELAQALREFVESHVQLQKTIDHAKEQIAEAVRAIEERDKTKTKVKTAARPTRVGDGTDAQLGSGNASLFDAATAPTNKGDSKADAQIEASAEQPEQA